MEPKLLVLVQWKSLPAEDTTWEDWEVLKEVYHLEDKMSFDGEGNARKQTPKLQHTTKGDHQRPRRKSQPLRHLVDYVN